MAEEKNTHLDSNAADGTYNQKGAWTDNEILSADEVKTIQGYRDQMNAGTMTSDQANAAANAIRSGYGYTIDKQGNVTDTLAGIAGSASGGGGGSRSQGVNVQPIVDQANQQAQEIAGMTAAHTTGSGIDYDAMKQQAQTSAEAQKLQHTDVNKYKAYLDQWVANNRQQQENAIDYATNKGVTDLQRAEEDAQQQFQTQRNQIDIDEARAKDNQALYAEARGDRGGIGAAQYDSIMAAAATNRQTVNTAQTKLATDTQRQIADLRAQGDFQKADALLQIANQALSQLMELERWAEEFNIGVDQFNANVEQWLTNYLTQIDQMNISEKQWVDQFNFNVDQYNTGLKQWATEFMNQNAWNGANFAESQRQYNQNYQLSLDQFQQQQKQYADSLKQYEQQYADTQKANIAQIAKAMLDSSMPVSSLSAGQIAALKEVYDLDAQAYADQVKILAAQAALAKGGSGSGGKTPAAKTPDAGTVDYDFALEQAQNGYWSDAIVNTLQNKGYTEEMLRGQFKGYDSYLNSKKVSMPKYDKETGNIIFNGKTYYTRKALAAALDEMDLDFETLQHIINTINAMPFPDGKVKNSGRIDAEAALLGGA